MGGGLGRGCSLSVLKRVTIIASSYEKLMTVEMRVDLMKRETGHMEERKRLVEEKKGFATWEKRERRKMHKREPAVPTLGR